MRTRTQTRVGVTKPTSAALSPACSGNVTSRTRMRRPEIGIARGGAGRRNLEA